MTKRLSPRRWFAILMLVFALWAVVNINTSPYNVSKPLWPSGIVLNLTGPFAAPLRNWVQVPLFNAFHPRFATISDQRYDDLSQLHTNEIAVLRTQLEKLSTILHDHQLISEKYHDLQSIPATIVGGSTGDAKACVINRGQLDFNHYGLSGRTQKLVVLSNVAPLGYITSMGPTSSEVRLLTDPGIRIQARVVHETGPGQDKVIASNALISGTGNRLLVCDSVEKGYDPPQRGDLIELFDNEWPPELSGAVLGTVVSVDTSESNAQRYLLKIQPRVTVEATSQVSVCLPSE